MRQSGVHTGGNRRAPRPVGRAMAIRTLKLAALREWERLEARIAAGGTLPPWRPLARPGPAGGGQVTAHALLPISALMRGAVFLRSLRGAGPWLRLGGGGGSCAGVWCTHAGCVDGR